MTDHGNEDPLAPQRSLRNPSSAMDTPTQSMPRVWADDDNPPDPRSGKPIPVPPESVDPEAAEQRRAERERQREEEERRRAEKQHEREEAKRQSEALKQARRANARRPQQTRRARLRLTRVDPWSVTKISFLLSIAFGVMCVVAVFFVFSIMSASGLWTHVNEAVQGVLNQKPSDQFDITEYVNMSRVLGITMLVAAVDVVLITALATLGAFIYNLAAAMLGGLEVTLAEDVK